MDFSIIIPTRNRHGLVLRCVGACLALPAQGISREIIVVASGADPILRKLLEPLQAQHSCLRFVEEEQPGVNRARNRGVELARGKFLYFLDDDCVVPADSRLSLLKKFFQESTEFVGIGGPYTSSPISSLATRYYNALSRLWLYSHESPGKYSTRLLGGNSCFRKEVFTPTFRFHAEIEYGGAESEFQCRLVARGAKFCLWESLAVVHENSRLQWTQLFRRAWRQGRARADLVAQIKHKKEASYGRRIMRLRPRTLRALVTSIVLIPYFFVGQCAFVARSLRAKIVAPDAASGMAGVQLK